jgi:hypothetical protein
MTILLLIPAAVLLGIIIWFFISTVRALKKFDSLDTTVQKKLLLLDYYMAAVRNFSKEDLITLSALSNEELKRLNTIHSYNERIQAMREKRRRDESFYVVNFSS